MTWKNKSNEATQTIAETVADQIREQIFDGTLHQGEPLREVALAESQGVSRRTIREALLHLASQRLVLHERNRGAIVRTLRRDDVLDLYKCRRTLELEGARNSPFARDSSRHTLREAYDRLHEATYRQDSREMIAADLEFHGAVVKLAESPRLDSFYQQIGPEMEMALAVIRGGEHMSGFRAEHLIADHRVIHDALQAREVIEAQRAILAHIDFNERYLLSLIEQ